MIASLVGPALLAIVVSEFPLVQPHLYDAMTPPVVYISGMVLFVGGLAIVRFHNLWTRDWRVALTLTGWGLLALGLARLFLAARYSAAYEASPDAVFVVIELALIAIGALLTYQGYFGRE